MLWPASPSGGGASYPHLGLLVPSSRSHEGGRADKQERKGKAWRRRLRAGRARCECETHPGDCATLRGAVAGQVGAAAFLDEVAHALEHGVLGGFFLGQAAPSEGPPCAARLGRGVALPHTDCSLPEHINPWCVAGSSLRGTNARGAAGRRARVGSERAGVFEDARGIHSPLEAHVVPGIQARQAARLCFALESSCAQDLRGCAEVPRGGKRQEPRLCRAEAGRRRASCPLVPTLFPGRDGCVNTGDVPLRLHHDPFRRLSFCAWRGGGSSPPRPRRRRRRR